MSFWDRDYVFAHIKKDALVRKLKRDSEIEERQKRQEKLDRIEQHLQSIDNRMSNIERHLNRY